MTDTAAPEFEARIRAEALWAYRMLDPSRWYPAELATNDLPNVRLHTPEGVRHVMRGHFIVRRIRREAPTP